MVPFLGAPGADGESEGDRVIAGGAEASIDFMMLDWDSGLIAGEEEDEDGP